MTLDATFQASRLKHAVAVLRRVNDEAIFKIESDKIMSSVMNPGNTLIVQVEIDATGGHIHAAEPHDVGIDLERLAGVITRAAAKDHIAIEADDLDTWQITRGVHQRTMGLLNPKRLRKYPDWVELLHTVTVKLSGKMFKEVIAEVADVGADHVAVHATEEVMTLEAISKDMRADTYTAKLPADQYYEEFESEASCKYDCDYLKDIVADMKATDSVAFKFSTDAPCEIEYERDGMKIRFMLAPRIDST